MSTSLNLPLQDEHTQSLEGKLSPGRRRWQPADTVIAVTVALLVAIFAIFAFLCVQGYATTVENTKVRAQTAADVIADEMSSIVRTRLAVLEGVSVQLDDKPLPASLKSIARLEAVESGLPASAGLDVYDAAGNPAAGGTGPAISDSEVFEKLQAGATWAISAQEKGSDGAPSFMIGKRLNNGGAFAGVVTARIDGSLVEALWTPQNLGPDSTVALVRDDGKLIARHPALPDGLDLGPLPVFQRLTATRNGSYESEASPADGVARVVAFRQVPGLHFIALASVSRDAVIAGLFAAIYTVLWLLGPIALALLAGSLWTAHLLRKSARIQHNLAAAVAHNEVLFREIHHRVKNNLQSVASLLQMQPIPPSIKADMGQRIAAMSAVHEHIYRSNNFDTVTVKDYLHTLIANIRAGSDPKVQVIEALEDVSVDKDAAAPLGLILNEVVSNAFKHAFSDGREGVINVSLTRENPTTGKLVISDNGVGFDPSAPTKGIGRRLIGGLTSQIGGTSGFDAADGSRFTLTFPLAK